MSVDADRLYRFAPRDRAGWILGLGASQCLTLAAGLLMSTVAVSSGAPVELAAVPLASHSDRRKRAHRSAAVCGE